MKILSTLVFLLFVGTLNAQTKCACCDEVHDQFDFWVGEWLVTDTLGNTVGENSITKIEGNCVVLEKWKGSKGSTGTSMNYYDNTDSSWNQLWVDKNGMILKLKGSFTNGSMVLRSELLEGKKTDWYYHQISWTPNKDGTVSQLWEVYDKNGNVLKTLFLGIYRRK